MSQTADLSEMTRDELEERVRELERELADVKDQVDKNAKKPGNMAIAHLIEALTGEDIDDYTRDAFQHKPALQEFHQRFERIEKTVQRLDELAQEEESLTSDPNVENWQAIVNQAQNLANHPEHATQGGYVKLYKKQIAAAAGVSERHAQDLIEEYGADPDDHNKGKQGTDWQEHKRRNTSRQTESSGIQKKALLINMERWGEN